MAGAPDNRGFVSSHAKELYDLAVKEMPPEKTQLDKLVDYLRLNPWLLFSEYFVQGYQAAEITVGAWHGHVNSNESDETIEFLTTMGTWGWVIMEDSVCMKPPTKQLFKEKYPELVRKFLDIAGRTLSAMDHTPTQIVRRTIQALTRFWSTLFRLCNDDEDSIWANAFGTMRTLADKIRQKTQACDDPMVLMHLVKFLEVEATIFSPAPTNSPPKNSEIGLDECSASHPYLSKQELEDRGSSARQLLISLLPNGDTPRLFNSSFITAIINSIIYMLNQRPQHVVAMVEPLMAWFQSINSTYHPMMSHIQSEIINKTLRVSLFLLYRRPHMGPYAVPLEEAMDALGGNEWIAWQERQARVARAREREEKLRARERSKQQSHQSQAQLQQQKQYNRQPQLAQDLISSQNQSKSTSSRWAPVRDDEYETMADQPAPMIPGTNSMYAEIPPPPPLPPNLASMIESFKSKDLSGIKLGKSSDNSLRKRGSENQYQSEDEDEEQQLKMLEEGAKRVKLDMDVSAQKVPDTGSASLSNLDNGDKNGKPRADENDDMEMEKEVLAAISSGPFILPPVEQFTNDDKAAYFKDTFQRILNACKSIRKMIESSSIGIADCPGGRVGSNGIHIQSNDASETAAAKNLSNGLITNAGILEDSMLMLVRLISDLLVDHTDYINNNSAEGDVIWPFIHQCAGDVINYIIESPRAHYGLAQAMLYEIWLAVICIDPKFKMGADMEKSNFTVLSFYYKWCEQIFGSMIECSIESTISNEKQMQLAPDKESLANGASGANVPHQPTPIVRTGEDRLISNFILDVPYFPKEMLEKLQKCFANPKTAQLGIAACRDATKLRPPLRKEGLELILGYCVHHSRQTRIPCILAVKEYYSENKYSSLIDKFAVTAMKRGVTKAMSMAKELDEKIASLNAATSVKAPESTGDTSPVSSDKNKAEIIHKNGEADIEAFLVSHIELFLSLCMNKMILFSELLSVYATATAPIQASILHIVMPFVQSLAKKTPDRFVPVLEDVPAGSELLVIRVIIPLTDGIIPTPALTKALLNIYEKNNSDARFLVLAINGLDRAEILKRLPDVVKMLNNTDDQKNMVRECIQRLTRPLGGKPSRLSPTELIIALHDIEDDVGVSRACEAIQICIDMDMVFTSQILAAALLMLVGKPVIPALTMQTAMLSHMKHRNLTGFLAGLIQKLISKSVWNMPRVWGGFIKCCQQLLPASLSIMLTIPQEHLKQMIKQEPSIQSPLKEYVEKITSPQRERYIWLFDTNNLKE